MPNGTTEVRPADPETLLIVGVIGGLLAIGTFVLYDWASRVGPQLETPGPVRALHNALLEIGRPFQPETEGGVIDQLSELSRAA